MREPRRQANQPDATSVLNGLVLARRSCAEFGRVSSFRRCGTDARGPDARFPSPAIAGLPRSATVPPGLRARAQRAARAILRLATDDPRVRSERSGPTPG